MPFKTSGECIQNMIEKETPPRFKPERYISKHRLKVQEEIKSCRLPNKTMGNAHEPLPTTADFLKKNSKNFDDKRKHGGEQRCLLTERRPPVPKYSDSQLQRNNIANENERGRTFSRNFLKENVRRVIKSAPPRLRPKFVDSHKGSIQQVENSGLKPQHVYKKNFGKAPQCLLQRDKETSQRQTTASNGENDYKMHLKVSEEERIEILNGLKISLDEKNREFLLLPVIIDTPYLINYKRKLEKIISQLEKDIKNIESHAVIFIAN